VLDMTLLKSEPAEKLDRNQPAGDGTDRQVVILSLGDEKCLNIAIGEGTDGHRVSIAEFSQ